MKQFHTSMCYTHFFHLLGDAESFLCPFGHIDLLISLLILTSLYAQNSQLLLKSCILLFNEHFFIK